MPNRQATLFEPPLSHTNDPITSFEAADRMVKSGALSRQERAVWKAVKWAINNMAGCLSPDHCNFTAKELADWSGISYFKIQRRLSGLHNKDKIERLNTNGEKYQENKGQKLMKRNKCAVWRIK